MGIEDPEKAIDEYMRSLSSDLGKVRAETASLLVEESRAKRALDLCKSEIQKLRKYAEKAAEGGNEEEARKFLEKKAAQAEKESQLQASYDTAASKAACMQEMQDKLSSDIARLEVRHAKLKEKLAAAKAQEKLNSIGPSMSDAEEKINRAYDEAMILAELREGTKKDDPDNMG